MRTAGHTQTKHYRPMKSSPHSVNPSSAISVASSRKGHVVDDIASVEAALRKILPTGVEERLLAQIPQWFLVTGMFKDLEIAYTALEDRSSVEDKYRAVLTAVMSLGENIHAGLKDRPELDIKAIGYCPKVVESNLRYLRAIYRQWFVPRNAEKVAKVIRSMEGEGAASI